LIPVLDLGFLVSGYVLIVSFFIVQRRLRRTERARSFRGGAYDKGNMLLIGSATGIGLSLPLILDALGVAVLPVDLVEGLAAFSVMVLGIALRVWAAITLGEYYTTTLMMTEGQKLVTTGPYARVRHPGYLGEILIWTGLGVLSSNLIAMILLPVMFVVVLLYRISSEERMLAKELGNDYVQYQRRTCKLIPFVY
jgi:protein-S-isoprenylcysteine O-methyltransferase Ste14